MTSLNKVRDFWEGNPLWSGESEFEEGTLDFFKSIVRFIMVIALLVVSTFDSYRPRESLDKILSCSTWVAELVFGLRNLRCVVFVICMLQI